MFVLSCDVECVILRIRYECSRSFLLSPLFLLRVLCSDYSAVWFQDVFLSQYIIIMNNNKVTSSLMY